MAQQDIIDSEDLPTNLTQNEHFQDVVARATERRGFLKKGLGLSAALFLAGPLAACGGSSGSDDSSAGGGDGGDGGGTPAEPLLGFKAIGISTADTITVPEGYSAVSFVPWGTPLMAGAPAWKGDGSEDAAAQALQVGENHDGIHYFAIDGKNGEGEDSTEGLLVMNHEYCTTVGGGTYQWLFGPNHSPEDWDLDKAHKSMNAHGVSVIHIKRSNGKWDIVQGSNYNRRITAQTEMELTGPAAGDVLVRTNADPTGRKVFGTINNCGNGWTPWGTYLTCEENFNNYFGTTHADGDQRDDAQKRYGLSATSTGYRWQEVVDRFDYVKEPNESNRFGWIVEIDPFTPNSIPKKRTALGRIKHENAAYNLTADKRIVVYSGDDQANDYIYKFVSEGKFVEGGDNSRLLDKGKLYVAKFNADKADDADFLGKGEWVLLDKDENATLRADARFPNQAAVLVYARLAGDAVGATKMDRPEWVSVHPSNGDVYVTLTNNSGRAESNAANPRNENIYGHIARWRETGGDAAAMTFEWDIFVLAGNPNVYGDDDARGRAGSDNITKDNTFNSPDGLGFDKAGRLWIQTDGQYSNAGDYEGQGNNQMLCADPVTKEIRRFLVGPKECEVTGLTFTPDSKTLFINIQHPGERGDSHWPNGSGMPRSATVIVTKDDGGVIGS
ncbi:PhoX family phosphatase [Pusillimonas sp. CC-YST705]|uniref:PhoX family phosphatase n=1 Tax=Mesopusillimonas faecipullorum TaxID=2755040 RepID=A0ABS8CEH9_9BURK|nr:PhoX family phosphatase [Mesopusillimonas faecipullorum]MCB5363984.1 PhoX family phosphatase [Mesopusillimonas faecipullorum]